MMFALRASDVRLWRENFYRQRGQGGATRGVAVMFALRASDVRLRRVMFALRASDVRLWRENSCGAGRVSVVPDCSRELF